MVLALEIYMGLSVLCTVLLAVFLKGAGRDFSLERDAEQRTSAGTRRPRRLRATRQLSTSRPRPKRRSGSGLVKHAV